MYVSSLELQDFRNYEHLSVSFASGLNLVTGANAQGKTNLLEAVYCLSGLGSPRAADAALVRTDQERAVLHGTVVKGQREISVDLELKPGRGPRALLNKSPMRSARALAEVVPSVFFGPDELSLVKGSPDGRRRFLDDLVVKLRPTKEGVRREWERTLKQRNALLKGAGRDASRIDGSIEVWNEAFVRAGAALTAHRLAALGALLPYARKRYEAIAGGGALDLTYVSSWVSEETSEDALQGAEVEGALQEQLAARLAQLRIPELERGASLAGPQRDDVSVKLAMGDHGLGDARTFASQGDQRSSALALKLAEHELLTEVLDEAPLLLLDDVFSELDSSRRGWLADAVRDSGQALLSSAEPLSLGDLRPELTLRIKAGRVVR